MAQDAPVDATHLDPQDSGVNAVQVTTPGSAVALTQPPTERGSIPQSAIANALLDAEAFKTRAAKVLAGYWAEDVHRRLGEAEAEVTRLRNELGVAQLHAARLEERLRALRRARAAEELLTVLGGAVIGTGFSLIPMPEYGWTFGCIVVAVGLILIVFPKLSGRANDGQ